jgi:hypothetical protein
MKVVKAAAVQISPVLYSRDEVDPRRIRDELTGKSAPSRP